MHLKQNRLFCTLLIGIIYFAAAFIGIKAYAYLPFSWWLSLLIADIIATVFVFIFSLIFNNASVYDPYWSVQPAVIICAFASRPLSPIKILLLVAVLFWSIRLTANWCYTFHSLEYQDWRYVMLKEKTGVFYPIINLIGIHLVPTLVVYLCITPAVYVFINDARGNILSYVCILLSVCAASMQGIADIQMHRFRKNKTGTFIRNGLWRYSRHPNYLGEILMWWGIGLCAFALFPTYPWLLSGAIANTLLFLFISIPMADKRQSKKQGFAIYKKETRMLLPIKK